MSQAGFIVAVVGLAVIAGTVALAGSGERCYVPAGLVEIEAVEIEKNLEEFTLAEACGHLMLAARGSEVCYLYAKPEGLNLLEELGVEYQVLLEDATSVEIYEIPRAEDLPALPASLEPGILKEEASFFLVGVEAGAALEIHLLPFKKRLPLPSEKGLPLVAPVRALTKPYARPLGFNPLIEAMVDSVSESRLFSTLCDLSGENPVVVGGETHTISTRYSPTFLNEKAAEYILERFQELGLEAEYDYFNFLTQMRSIVFPVDNQKGWTVGRGALILYTEDGGLVWEKQYDGDEGTLNDIVMVDATHGCVVGNGGVIMVTQNGSDWQTVYPPTSNDLNGLFFVDAMTAYCCGVSGTILKSVDGGNSWANLSSGTSRDLNSICFVNPDVGWVVGTYGHIRRTQNGGSSWSSVSSPVSNDLLDIAFQGEQKGWICGTSGTVLKTEDGATWEEVTSPVSDDLCSIFFVTEQVGWACGKRGSLIKSWNGGATWSDLNFPATVNLRDALFINPNEGWIVGAGLVRHSTNGGLDWEDQRDGIRAGDVNVVGTKQGTTDPEEIYIICGHYDCISQIPQTYAPGADDNGTGTVSVIEAARVLGAYDFEATMRFVCFTREEQGLVGSGAYVREAYERGDSIVAALNFDMIGYEDVHPEDVNIICNTPSQWLGDEYEDAVSIYVPDLDIHRQTASHVGSDNSSFWDYGYTSFCGIEDYPLNNPQYHRTTDRVSTIDFDFYTDVVKGAVATLARMARVDTVTSSVARVPESGMLRASPNPGRGVIAFEMRTRGDVAGSFEIYDVGGRLVTNILAKDDGGVLRATWHGTDVSGSRVGPGIYFVRPSGDTRATKVILLK
jgi:photosystem II stability/assembly factor-like uncharacterized protein